MYFQRPRDDSTTVVFSNYETVKHVIPIKRGQILCTFSGLFQHLVSASVRQNKNYSASAEKNSVHKEI